MNIPFLGDWLKRHGTTRGTALSDVRNGDLAGVAQLFSECTLLRDRAETAGVELDGSAASLHALDQLKPRWRDDPDELLWLGNDAGLYLGTVIVRNVSEAQWRLHQDGTPLVLLPSGRELDVVGTGRQWATDGAPELSQVYAEVSEG